jgi:hypothetical protein
MAKTSSSNRWPTQVTAWAKALWVVMKLCAEAWHEFHS